MAASTSHVKRSFCTFAPRGRLQVLHTQLLLRGGTRTPLQPLKPVAYWQATLPEPALLNRLTSQSSGGARLRPGQQTDMQIWGELTTRGIDEAHATGLRLERWLAEQGSASIRPSEKDEQDEEDDEDQVLALTTRVLTMPCRRSQLTARAVLSGVMPRGFGAAAVRADTSSSFSLQVRQLHPDIQGLGSESGNDTARKDAALDLTELLALDTDELSDASWPRLLDVTECAATFGLLPKGELTEATWQAVLKPPLQTARIIASDEDLAAFAVGPLIRLTMAPCIEAARSQHQHDEGREMLRIVVMPGFSMLCWAAVMKLTRASLVWPAPTTSLMVETLADEIGQTFIRFWQPRDTLELRPRWHQDEGPVPLEHLAKVLQRQLQDDTVATS